MNNSYIENIKDLDEILFYSGEYSRDAASYVVNREFGAEVPDLGILTEDPDDRSIYFSRYPNVRYKERRTDLQTIGDLYTDTLSYLLQDKNNSFSDEFCTGYSYIANNRYNAIYTYESDLSNDFDNATPWVSRDLNDFLIGLNTQLYNKRKFYGDYFEVDSVKIDQTYFTWYPEHTVAYTNEIKIDHTVDFTYYLLADVHNDNAFDGPYDGEETVYVKDNNKYVEYETISKLKEYADENSLYLYKMSYSYIVSDYDYIPYEIGGQYYSYIQHSYNTIFDTLLNKVDEKLDVFRDKYGVDQSIYAYYMYDCHSDIEMLLTTRNLGVKHSTFKISFTSEFDKWFDNTINIKLSEPIAEGNKVAKITSGLDNKIYSIFANKKDRITGNNVTLNKDKSYTFTASVDIVETDEINILTPYAIDTLDLGAIKDKVGTTLSLTKNPWIEQGLNMRCLILDDGDDTRKCNFQKIYGLNEISTLEYIDFNNVDKLIATPAFDKLENLKVFKAKGSNIDSFRVKTGLHLYDVELPETVKSIKLLDTVFEPGTLKVHGIEQSFDGVFNYTPTTNLVSLTLRNIDNDLSYSLVSDWYDVLDAENKLDSFIYLELQGFNWKNIKAQQLINLKKFDINPNFAGHIEIFGSGNYHWLTRNEYQDIIRLYGVMAFSQMSNSANKVFKDLFIVPQKNKKETFEFSLKIKNNTVEAFNETILDTDRDSTKYEPILNLECKEYRYDAQGESELDPYLNRAANAFLDIIYNDNNTVFTFKKDEIDNFAYCKLPRTIDTSNSVEIKKIKRGDILLFNGDTLVIYFEDTNDLPYEFVKIGSISDVMCTNGRGISSSSIGNWFKVKGYDEFEIEFIPAEREIVIQDLVLTASEDIIFDKDEEGNDNEEGIYIAVDIDEYALEHIDEIKNTTIKIEYNDELLVVNEIEETDRHYILYNIKPVSGYQFNSLKTSVIKVYCDANREDTIQEITITLRKRIEWAYVEDTTLVLDNLLYSIENNTLIVNSNVNAIYDEETRTLTID